MIRILSNLTIRQLSTEELSFDLLFQMENQENEDLELLDSLKDPEMKSETETLLDDGLSETESEKEERGSMDSIEYFVKRQKEKKKNQSLQEAESIEREGSSPIVKKTCPGCSPIFQPNQEAHMCEGGCLEYYEINE